MKLNATIQRGGDLSFTKSLSLFNRCVLTLESMFLSGLIAAVPDDHKEFLRNLALVHEQGWLACVLKCFRYDRSPEEFTTFTFRAISGWYSADTCVILLLYHDDTRAGIWWRLLCCKPSLGDLWLLWIVRGVRKFLTVWRFRFKQEGEETGDPETSYTKLIAVHAGLESKSVDNQMQMLQNKDAQRPRIEPLAGRKNVWNNPPVRSPSLSLVSSPNHNSLSRFVFLELFLHQRFPLPQAVLVAR